ncbi:hypothetical protein ARALYDRAFT_920674 [Arabidopsis lyrata subsp. lyrata]|uniref:Beta-fructofuranosidase n=1 Tax=Arabidopsis lyrata subsp. lyrata TaxID=81972 RepID=D7MXJ9_ARALL|nr:hypothetical protein ARALYDRAFT_920674 [Arabidopsis lyrata subsp. lyrata]
MSPHGGLFVGNVTMLSSLATPEIIDLIESRLEELVGEMPLKVCYPAIGSHEWRIVTGCDPKNTRWSYHNNLLSILHIYLDSKVTFFHCSVLVVQCLYGY